MMKIVRHHGRALLLTSGLLLLAATGTAFAMRTRPAAQHAAGSECPPTPDCPCAHASSSARP